MLLYWWIQQGERSPEVIRPIEWDPRPTLELDHRTTLVLLGLIVAAIVLTLLMEWVIKTGKEE